MARNSPERAIITLYSGTHIDLLCPDPALIVIDDIAAGLSKINRFSGATFRPYTVAEHLLLGVEYLIPENRFKWFTHDFSEAYLNDVVGPLRMVAGLSFYRDLDAQWERAIAERFGIPAKGAKEVRSVDGRMLVTERRDLAGRRPLSSDRHKPFAMHLPAAAPSQDWLQQNFLATFYALARDTEGALI